MAEPVYVNVTDSGEGADLVRALGRHGLLASLVRTQACWQVEIRSAREDPRTFLADIGVALAACAPAAHRRLGGRLRRSRGPGT